MGFDGAGDSRFHSRSAALEVGKEVEIGAVFHQGCRTALEFIGKASVCVDGYGKDRKLAVTASTRGDALAVTTSGNRVRIRAVREGDATVSVSARNSRGDARSTTLSLQAAKPERIAIDPVSMRSDQKPGCFDDRTPSKLWFEAGKPFTLAYELVSGDQRAPLRIIATAVGVSAKGGAAFSQVAYRELRGAWGGALDGAEGTYLMGQSGTVTLESSTTGFRAEVGAYSCATLTGIAFRNVDAARRIYDVAHMMGDDPVCTDASACPITVTVETPEVCELFSMKGQPLSKGSAGKQSVALVAPGTCRLSAAAAGTPFTATLVLDSPARPPKSGG
jgi:hypothetical protein